MKTRPTYDVYLIDQTTGEVIPEPTRVEIKHGDQLRAELEGPRHGLTKMDAAPLHFATLWVWAALVRMHVIDVDFQTFLASHLEELEKPDDAPQLGMVKGDDAADPSSGGPSTSDA